MFAETILIMVILAISILAIVLGRFRRVTIYEYEKALKYTKGKFKALLEPGRYWYSIRATTIRKLDIRPAYITIPGQEVITADNAALKVSIVAVLEIVDPYSAINNVDDFHQAFYAEVQMALRDLTGSRKIDDLLTNRAELNQALLAMAQPKVEALGLRLQSVGIKDIMFTNEVKKILMQTLNAQKESQAALEKARGETAALRNLANAAKMLESNPNLMQLRLLQVLGDSSGNTVVMNQTGATGVIIPGAKGQTSKVKQVKERVNQN